jgi:hypothetical protein
MLDVEINEEVAKLSPQDQEEAMRLLEKFYRNLARSRRHEADLLASVASGLTDPRGVGHNHVERIKDFVREIVRDPNRSAASSRHSGM